MSTKIAWVTNPDSTKGETWNPIVGCSKTSEGCRFCYAETMARRLKGMGLPQYQDVVDEKGWTGEIAFVPDALEKPLRWRKPRRVFVGSMTDLFHPDVSDWTIGAIFGVMAAAIPHTFQVLTKRASRLPAWFQQAERSTLRPPSCCTAEARRRVPSLPWTISDTAKGKWPLPNVWLGVTIENQQAANERIPHLLKTQAAVQFVSVEPMLGPIDLIASVFRPGVWDKIHPDHGFLLAPSLSGSGLSWVIIGCESGPKRRPMQLEWALDLVRQCKAADVPVFVKQLDIDGKVSHNPEEWPAELRVREYPR